jgi:hypothetical protein
MVAARTNLGEVQAEHDRLSATLDEINRNLDEYGDEEVLIRRNAVNLGPQRIQQAAKKLSVAEADVARACRKEPMETASESIRPQRGPQEAFARTAADIAIFGGSAGGGKSFSLLLEPLYHIANSRFRGVIFRRTVPQLRLQGGLWDTSMQLYPEFGAVGLVQGLEWRFPTGARINFAGMEHETDRLNWQGAQIPFIGFDEICQFSAAQFWYLLNAPTPLPYI